jgi:hypothetical protein
MLCLDCTFGVLVEVSSTTRFLFVCLYLNCAVIFNVLFGVSSSRQSFRLSSLVGEVWVVYYYLFLCGLLSLSLSVLGEWCALVFAYYLDVQNQIINYVLDNHVHVRVLTTFWRRTMFSFKFSSTLKIEAACSSKTLLPCYQTTRCHNTVTHNKNCHHCKTYTHHLTSSSLYKIHSLSDNKTYRVEVCLKKYLPGNRRYYKVRERLYKVPSLVSTGIGR